MIVILAIKLQWQFIKCHYNKYENIAYEYFYEKQYKIKVCSDV